MLKNSENNVNRRGKKSGTEDRAHKLKALTSFPENPGSIPSTHMAAVSPAPEVSTPSHRHV